MSKRGWTVAALALAVSLAVVGNAALAQRYGASGGGYRGAVPPPGAYRGGGWQGGAWAGTGRPPAGAWVARPGWGHGWAGRPGWGYGWAGRPGWGWGWGPGWAWGPGWGWNTWGWNRWGGWGWGVGWNPGWAWGPGFWGWSVGAPIVVAPATGAWALPPSATVYVERAPEAPLAPVAPAAPAAPRSEAPPEGLWWYWCNSANAYYPYVNTCPEPWQRVAPQVPPGVQ
jgi:hypothetical protein